MLFEVDFAIKINESFCTIYIAFLQAETVSECHSQATEIANTLPQSKNHEVHIFIEN